MAVSVSFAQPHCGERGELVQVRQTPIHSHEHGEAGSQGITAECGPSAGHSGQVPSVPPAFKIRSRTLGWALFVALGAYQLLLLTR